MALSPLLLAERRRRGVCKKVESVPDCPLALCRGSGAALANPALAKPLTASTYQPENLGPDCWNLLSVARGPTRVNRDDNRVTCWKAIALLIWPPTSTVQGYL
jgi:hypothetical protein